MNIIKDLILDEERALYNIKDTNIINCKFDGIKDGESAIKECNNIIIDNCYFNLRYPMWHVDYIKLLNSTLTTNSRAALWYSHNIYISDTTMHGIKALRECNNIEMTSVDIDSSEFGWKSNNIIISDATINGEYAFFEAKNIKMKNITFSGKYSFQYCKNLTIDSANINTKDAFWHAENVVVTNSYIKGEYLGWYSKNITFINCTIEGTQPLCYVEGLKIINCKMIKCDLAFERSTVEADIIGMIDSIKNPLEGYINVENVKEVILDLEEEVLNCKLNIEKKENVS